MGHQLTEVLHQITGMGQQISGMGEQITDLYSCHGVAGIEGMLVETRDACANDGQVDSMLGGHAGWAREESLVGASHQ